MQPVVILSVQRIKLSDSYNSSSSYCLNSLQINLGMSLFKVRDFWTFELNQLADQFTPDKEQNGSGGETRGQDVTCGEAKFVASLGQFHSIGHHDVFVCGNLNGFICIIQVPQSECQKNPLSKSLNPSETDSSNKSPISSGGSSGTNANETTTKNSRKNSNLVGGGDIKERQLLAAQQLPFPIVDLKSGFFTSAIKQSIAVLSFDKFIVYQVKHNQLDLLSIDDYDNQSNLFTHKLEEHHRIDLLSNEIGANLVVLDRHFEERVSSKAISTSKQGMQTKSLSSHHIRKSLDHHSSVQQLHLPQRDTLVIQYTNQFLFTIVDHKKVVGHFSVYKSCLEQFPASDIKTEDSDQHINKELVNRNEQLSKFVGFQPMTFHKSSKSSSADLSIALSLSDYTIHSIPLAKLLSEAKQNVMRRVAQNLLHDKNRNKENVANISPAKLISSLVDSYDNSQPLRSGQVESIIDLDLHSIEQWQFQLVYEPIQMQSIQRQTTTTIDGHENSGQILVMSRYNLDLISSSGQHLWSQRFETPLICIYNYTITNNQIKGEDTSEEEQRTDKNREINGEKLLTFVCTDCLSSEKCNLIILEEDKIVWSALLNAIPLQIWRSKLASKVFSTIATLDVTNSQLSVSYLGTNLDIGCDEQSGDDRDLSSQQLVANLNNQFDDKDCYLDSNKVLDDDHEQEQAIDCNGFERRKLLVDVRLEASDHWPNVKVESKILIKPRSGNTSGLLQNIVAILEFDDLIEYQPLSHQNEFLKLNEYAIQMQLGNCWPDRREPLKIVGIFSLKISSIYNPTKNTMDNKFHQIVDTNFDGKLSEILPKSLKVNIFLRFNETHASCSFQEESFLLPFSMIAKLVHIDYSSGQNQSVEDVQENLHCYNREQYYACDLFIRSQIKMIEVIEEIIESDLICRGLNSESSDLLLKGSHRRKFSTVESINLLAQSLDCRLKFKSDPPSDIDNPNDSSQEYISSPVVMISIALELFNGGHQMNAFDLTKREKNDYSTVWLHVTDFGENESNLPEELIQQHAKDWKTFTTVPSKIQNENINSDFNKGGPVLISIESDSAIPILFLHSHLIQRLKVRAIRSTNNFKLMPMLKTNCNAIQANYSTSLSEGDFIAINTKLHDCLKVFLENYEKNFKVQIEQLRNELPETFYKFNLSSFTSLSLSKRLFSSPDIMLKQLNIASTLTKKHHQDLLKLLAELENFSKLDYHYSKLPQACDIFIEMSENQLVTWPDFVQLID